MGQDSRGVMNVRLIEQLIELNAVVKPSAWVQILVMELLYWNHRVVYLFTWSLLLFLLFTFLFYLSTVSFCWYAFFFKLFAIYVLNILEYMNRQQQPGKTALICYRDAQADLGLRCPHMQKEPFSYDVALS